MWWTKRLEMREMLVMLIAAVAWSPGGVHGEAGNFCSGAVRNSPICEGYVPPGVATPLPSLSTSTTTTLPTTTTTIITISTTVPPTTTTTISSNVLQLCNLVFFQSCDVLEQMNIPCPPQTTCGSLATTTSTAPTTTAPATTAPTTKEITLTIKPTTTTTKIPPITTLEATTTAPETTTTTTEAITTTGTTTFSTTTEYPFKCKYTTYRSPQLSERRRRSAVDKMVQSSGHHHRSKRLAYGSDIPVDCQYPGIVALIKDAGQDSETTVGSGLILDESHVLVAQYGTLALQGTPSLTLTVHTGTYNLTDVSTVYSIQADARQDLVPGKSKLHVYTVTPELTFDTRCTLPACIPSDRLTKDDIDFTDCRVVASGVYNDTDVFNPILQTSVQEVPVNISTADLTDSELTLTRVDDKTSIMCQHDGGASVICPVKSTGEWMTVGMGDAMALPCTSQEPAFVTTEFYNFLSPTAVYTALQQYQYSLP